MRRYGNTKKLWPLLWTLVMGFQLLKAAPMPQNPIEALGMGAMSIAGSVAEVFQNGAALRKEGGFETPLFAMNSKTAVGMGQAIQAPRSDSDEDSDEDRRRRKRSVADLSAILPLPDDASPQPHLHRGKRSPCHTGTSGGGTGVDYPDEEAVERRKRQRKMAKQRKAAKNAKKARSKTKKLTEATVERRRRQVEVDLTPTVDGAGKKIGEHAKKFAEGVRSVWDSMVSTAKGVMEQVKQTIGGGSGGTQDGAGMQPPSDVEFV